MGAPESLLAAIDAELARCAPFTGIKALSAPVRAALAAVPREAFVPEAERKRAYVDRALPIGHRQTISQPFMVALMTELLELGPADRVLEVGTGSGYQAAILARLAGQVFSVELIPELARGARAALDALGIANVAIRVGDGAEGWLDHAPYDAVIVTAGAPALPVALTRQLAPGGRLVAPLGRAHDHQTLTLVAKSADGSLIETALLPVAFVPLRSHPPPKT